MALTLRLQKGSPLTNEELDNNFIYLDTSTINKQESNPKLSSIANLSTNGMLSINENVVTPRTIIGSQYIVVANGDGIVGNPTISLSEQAINTFSINLTVSGLGITLDDTVARTYTLQSSATNNNTANTIVFRDSSGNFATNKITANNLNTTDIQIGQSTDPLDNFVLSIPTTPNRTMKISRGNRGSTIQDIINIKQDGSVDFKIQAKQYFFTGF